MPITSFKSGTKSRSMLAGNVYFNPLLNARGLFGGGGGGGNSDVINYVEITTTGNATSFGTLTLAREGASGCSSFTRGLFGGGYTNTNSNVIDYVTIMSTGNATDFGDLTFG